MKRIFPPLFLLIITGMISCEKNNLSNLPDSCQEYLSDKIIEQIEIRDDELFILSYFFDRENLPPYSSMLPVRYQLTVIKENDYKVNDKIPGGAMKLCANNEVFLSSGDQLYRIDNARNLVPLIKCEGFYIRDYAFDKQGNAWLSGEPGIMHQDEGGMINFTSSNSPLPTDITHGIAIDSFDVKWIMLDFEGILKIEETIWNVIENEDIPGLTEFSYLYNPIADNQNRLWFHVFNPDTTYTRSNLLIYDGAEWKYAPPFEKGNAVIKPDKYGNIWAIVNVIEEGNFEGSSVFQYENDIWVNYPIAIPGNVMVITLNADDENIYLGTTAGLYLQLR